MIGLSCAPATVIPNFSVAVWVVHPVVGVQISRQRRPAPSLQMMFLPRLCQTDWLIVDKLFMKT